MKNNQEALELQQGSEVFATAYAGISGLYGLPIVNGIHPHNGIKISLASDLP